MLKQIFETQLGQLTAFQKTSLRLNFGVTMAGQEACHCFKKCIFVSCLKPDFNQPTGIETKFSQFISYSEVGFWVTGVRK